MMKTKKEHIDLNLLVKRYQDGEEEALKVLIRRFHPCLKRMIYHQTQDMRTAEDIVQDCWYDIIKQLADITLKISFEAWASAIARHKAIDWIRGQQRLRTQARQAATFANEEIESDQPATEIDKKEEVNAAIKQLPAPQKIVLTMFYLENLSVQEISAILDVAEGTVKSRLFNAREKLKNIINP